MAKAPRRRLIPLTEEPKPVRGPRKRPPPKEEVVEQPVQEEIVGTNKRAPRKRPPPKEEVVEQPVQEEVVVTNKRAPRKRPPPKEVEPVEEPEEEEQPVPKDKGKKKAPPKRKLIPLADEQPAPEPVRDLFLGFHIKGKEEVPPNYIKYQLLQVERDDPEDIVLLRQKDWNSWDELYFSLEAFNSSQTRMKLAYEIYQNKVTAGSVGLRCKSCHHDTVQVQLVQTRAGDEGMSIFAKCSHCGIFGQYY